MATEQEEAAYEAAMALSVAGDCFLPPVTPPSPVNVEPETEPIERYSWTGVVQEWVSAPPVCVGATPGQEATYLEHWRQRRLAEERRHGEYLEMLKSDDEEEQREAEEEVRQPTVA
ncbi:Pre-mRNA-processing factor 39 [Hordeum vulgare]|nr:Pre-mRNA-processing factor 39 [Hordeum vulgare]